MKLKDYPMYKESPFLAGMNIKTGNKAVGMGVANQMVDAEGVVSPVDIRMVIRKKVEKAAFIKLFDIDKLFLLSPIAIKLLLYLINKCPYGKDLVMFDPLEWMQAPEKGKNIKHSPKTIYAVIKELLSHGAIARSSQNNHYHINPVYGFKGNRLDLFKKR